jgi:hypothetical protein
MVSFVGFWLIFEGIGSCVDYWLILGYWFIVVLFQFGALVHCGGISYIIFCSIGSNDLLIQLTSERILSINDICPEAILACCCSYIVLFS